MNIDEDRSWSPPDVIDLRDRRTVSYWTQRLQVTQNELAEIIDEVGDRAAAVATACGRPVSLWASDLSKSLRAGAEPTAHAVNCRLTMNRRASPSSS